MKKIKILCFIAILFIGVCGYSQDTLNVSDTSYTLMPSIKESCKNIVFTDSMYRAWNAASIKNIKKSIAKHPNDCLEQRILPYVKGENYRLEFAKVLNNDSVISAEDIKKGFFIVEGIRSGSQTYITNYIITNIDNKLKVSSYKFNNKDITFHLINSIIISKKKFYQIYSDIRKQRREEELGFDSDFNVTAFSEENIDSYIFSCYGCGKCNNQFYKLIGENSW